jgi:hypothetical protein
VDVVPILAAVVANNSCELLTDEHGHCAACNIS